METLKLKNKDITSIMELLIISLELKSDFSILDDFELAGSISFYEKLLMHLVLGDSYKGYYDYYGKYTSDLADTLIQGYEKHISTAEYLLKGHSVLIDKLKNKWLKDNR